MQEGGKKKKRNRKLKEKKERDEEREEKRVIGIATKCRPSKMAVYWQYAAYGMS